MKNLNRTALRRVLMEEVLNASEMSEFSVSKSVKAVKKAGTKIINAGKAADLHLPISNLIKEMYKNLVDDGFGNTDNSSLYNEIEKINKK